MPHLTVMQSMKIILPVTIVLVIAAVVLFGNQEKPISFSNVRYESDAGGGSGKVIVEATQDEKAGLIALKVFAFKKEYVLNEEHLAELAGAQWNGMRVIYNSGIFGKTVWIRVEVATSGSTRDEALIRISSDGSIQAGRLPEEES